MGLEFYVESRLVWGALMVRSFAEMIQTSLIRLGGSNVQSCAATKKKSEPILNPPTQLYLKPRTHIWLIPPIDLDSNLGSRFVWERV